MALYSKEFKNPSSRRWYCRQRYAKCKIRYPCQTCRCIDDLMYIPAWDTCDSPSSILPFSTASTTGTSRTTVATTLTRPSTNQTFSSTLMRTFPTSKSSSIVLSSSTLKTSTHRTATSQYSTVLTSSFSRSIKDLSGTSTILSSSVGSVSTKRKPTSIASSPTLPPTTTPVSGDKEKVSTNASSNTGLIVGLCLGLLAIVICLVVFLYLRRGKKHFRGITKFNKEFCHVDITSPNGNSEAGSPTSPGYDYAYTQSPPGPTGARPASALVGNPVYDNKLCMPGQLHDKQKTDHLKFDQPVYQELVAEQMYADPNSSQGAEGEPVYRIVDEGETGDGSLGNPIYREVDEPPLYAETSETPIKPERAMGGPMQYQELNYSTRNNMYQPLVDDWKSEKYQRDV